MKIMSLVFSIVLFFALHPRIIHSAENNDWRARASAEDRDTYMESDTDEEVIFGREIAARILGQYKISGNEKLQKYVNLVGTTLAQNCNRPELDFHFVVIESSEINAYSTPGGYVFVTTAALSVMENEAELAGVLAHEIGHVIERHVVKELSLKGAEKSAVSSIAALIGGASKSAGIAFSQAVDKAVDIILRDGYKQEDEMQADINAVQLSAFSGYDPSGLLTLLNRVSSVKSGVGKTYPMYDVRLATIQKVISDEGLSGVKPDDYNAKSNKTAEAPLVSATGSTGATAQGDGVPVPVQTQASPARMQIEMRNSVDGTAVEYSIAMVGGKSPLTGVRLSVELPEGVAYLAGSSTLSGKPFAESDMQAQKLSFFFGNISAGWERKLVFRASADKAGPRELSARAVLSFETPKGKTMLTPPAEVSVIKITETKNIPVPDIVVRSHFPASGAELSGSHKAKLDEMVRAIRPLTIASINVTGYTDDVPFVKRSGGNFRNNIELSRARADNVGKYLMESLHIASNQIIINGRGASDPAGTNLTADGRARNRRVEVRVVAEKISEIPKLKIRKELSGMLQLEADTGEDVPVAGKAAAQKSSPVEGRSNMEASSSAAGSQSPSHTTSPLALNSERFNNAMKPEKNIDPLNIIRKLIPGGTK